jgi:hypothetical protein
MPGGRSQRPLFDLLRDKTGAEQRSHAPPSSNPPASQPTPRTAPVVEAKPVAAATSNAATANTYKPRVVSGMPRPAAADDFAPESPAQQAPTRGGLTIPVNAIYIAPVVVLVIVLAVWMLGVRWGRNDAERSLTDAGISLPVAPNDPLADQAPSGTSKPQPSAPVPAANPAPQPPTNSARTDTGPGGVPLDPKGKLLSSRGPIGADPRTKGLNYLHIASLPLDDAQNALAQAAKNQSWYQVVVLVGITGDEYRNRDKPGRAKQAESLIRKLGSQWKNDKRGPSDFSKILWVRCQ